MDTPKSDRTPSDKAKKRIRKKKMQNKPSIKELLLAGPRFEIPLPKRTRRRRRPPVEFD